ncbi:hypothetical protein [Chryseobacterium sp. MDT2-18]|uniref:hypothetical protein n=1 Tax=Chryseobacterium sp. MDT2-18 TaxID=1259136 RepID=UPI00277E060F|nr:hypothetical protein [Chryseobacterium sp. MDT2-18]MDQ0476165.1 putative lipoprotein NlpE involved in copper resistance [Chryseobacterium sp. MDT2-18]
MKKVLLSTMLVVCGGFAIAAPAEFNKPEVADLKEIVHSKSNDGSTFKEVKIVSVGGVESCYERYCTITSSTDSNGVITEKKSCSDWYQVPCTDLGESLPRLV